MTAQLDCALIPRQESKLSKTRQALSRFALTDTIGVLAALQLYPANAHQLGRIEAACAAALASARGTSKPSLAALLAILNGREMRRRYAHLEDPPEGLFCEQIAGPGGAYLIGCGMSGQSTFALRTLIGALRLWPAEDELVTSLMPLLMSALSVSDAVFRRAGMRRGVVWAGEQGGSVTAPPDLQMLVNATKVSLTGDDLVQAAEILAPLTIDAAGAKGKGTSELVARPFHFDDKGFTVVYPLEIASALRHCFATAILDASAENMFQLRCCYAVMQAVTDALTRMRMEPLSKDEVDLPWPEHELPMVESVFRFDTDKLVHVLCLVDDLSGYDRDRVFQSWTLERHETAVGARLDHVAGHLKGRADTNEVFSLVVLAPLDRGVELNFRHESTLTLCLAARDLEALSFSEYGDPLGLWKFAKSRTSLVARANVHAFSPLDLYVPYREHQRSFGMLEFEENIIAKPGGIGVLSQEASNRYDPHPVPHHTGFVAEAERWLPHAPGVPIYRARQLPGSSFECLVESGDDSWIWVCGPDSSGGEMVGHAIAYWLWQVANEIRPDLDRLADSNGVVRIEFDLAPEALWLSQTIDLTPRPDARGLPFSEPYALDSQPNGLRLLEGAWHALHNADNWAERELLRALLDLIIEPNGANRGSRIVQLVEEHAPPGYKKNVMMVRGPDPRLSERGLPPFRPVQSHDKVEANATVSARVLKRMKPPFGDDDVAAQRLLHAYVGTAFKVLEERVAALSPVDLLEQLVLANERVINEQAQRSFSMLTRVLGYGDLDEEIAERPEEVVRLNRAAICTRFLIEYVTTCPPSGSRPFSLAVVDELLALAGELLDAGGLSDTLRSQLARPQIVIIPPRIFLLQEDEAGDAHERFLDEQIFSEVANSDQVLEELAWKPEGDVPAPAAEVEQAIRAEFGLQAVEIVTALNTLIDHGLEREDGLVVLPVHQALRILTKLPGWDLQKAAQASELFTLGSRPKFLDPPAPHGRRDVYPWRTNRSLSYLRRPLLRRGDELIYGVRHLFSALRYFVDLIEDGRYPARSRELRKLQRRRGNAIGKGFERAVAEVFESHDYLVKRRVRSIGGFDLTNPEGRSLGDIDVLAVDVNSRRVVVADAKARKPGASPATIGAEAAELFGSGPKSTVSRQIARAAWVEGHLAAILVAFGVEPGEVRSWNVEPLIVTALPLVSSFLTRPQVRIVSFARLKEEGLLDGEPARLTFASAWSTES